MGTTLGGGGGNQVWRILEALRGHEPVASTDLATKNYVDNGDGLLIPKSLVTTKGDLVGRDASAAARVPAGADGSGLVADSSQALGVKYLPGDQAANVASQRTLGTGATQALAGNTGPAIWKSGTHAARLASSPASGWLWKETDTGLEYLYDGANWLIWKGIGEVHRTTDSTPVNNSTAQVTDTQLTFPIEVNEWWFVRALLRFSAASTASDLTVNFAVPTGLTIRGWTGTNALGVATGATPIVAGTGAAFGSTNGEVMATYIGWFLADATHNGNVAVKWAQNTATVEDTIMKAGSMLEIRRLA